PSTLMPNTHRIMKLSPNEESFLRHWMFDEVHFQSGQGAAKRLQVTKRVSPADVATLIAAAFPSITDQEAASHDPPSKGEPVWPWSEESFRCRLAEARSYLMER